ncbi:MAG: hypothetical protein GF353_26825, partial [Candidatus Lokiarchaeota archaeon]|nr:hypothetical protein [Candidatus Lokiarchaeota archaeon]
MGFKTSSICEYDKVTILMENMTISVYQELEDEISYQVKNLLKKHSNLSVKKIIRKIYKKIGKTYYVDKA